MPHLPPFDPAWDFKAAIPMRFAGRAIFKGAAIDKSQLPEDTRDRTLRTLYENHRIERATEEEAAALSPAQRGQLTDEQQLRVAALAKGNDRAALDKLAAEPPYLIADPDKLPSKEAVAEAIVRAEAGAA